MAIRPLAIVLALLAAAPFALAGELSPTEEAAVCRQLVVGMAKAAPGQAQTFRVRIAGRVLMVRATLNDDGSIGIEPGGDGLHLDLKSIRPLVDAKGRLSGVALDATGDGLADRGVSLADGGVLPVEADQVPGQPVLSLREYQLMAAK